ncbi:MAG: hypothetical protein ACR2MN_02335 [Acidimicrobiales bacterium]
MTQPNRQGGVEANPVAPSPIDSATGRPTVEVVAALADAAASLDSPPLMTQAVILPILVTGATAADITSALASSSLQAGRNLVAKGLGVIGWG